ncbi:hypothetical protein B0T24DRAFT_37782 [Lasiosphaeria ovina]|uniref:Uncharacterized protein n=1 Tax=Lasiosphaeria ovina TaxID=92902 RepID=A0AAE0NKH8_9PEZI|nr:hypothetical protein B0T24DRAFT_37782 [Lasiosphaeria ovina]
MIHAFELLTKAFCVPDTAIENHLIAASLLVFANFLVFWYNWKGTQMERRASSSASWGTRPGLGDAAGPDSGEIHAQDIGALTIAFRITGKSWPPTGSRTWTEKALAKHRLRGLRSLCFALRWLAKVVELSRLGVSVYRSNHAAGQPANISIGVIIKHGFTVGLAILPAY